MCGAPFPFAAMLQNVVQAPSVWCLFLNFGIFRVVRTTGELTPVPRECGGRERKTDRQTEGERARPQEREREGERKGWRDRCGAELLNDAQSYIL
jgi:hypothetical protein